MLNRSDEYLEKKQFLKATNLESQANTQTNFFKHLRPERAVDKNYNTFYKRQPETNLQTVSITSRGNLDYKRNTNPHLPQGLSFTGGR